MFIRSKLNKSGSTSVLVISKHPTYHVVKSFGSSLDKKQIELKRNLALDFISGNNLKLQIPNHQSSAEFFQNHIRCDSVTLIGPEMIFGKLFDEIGFNKINDEIFRLLVISRIIHPFSKSSTERYLNDYSQKQLDINSIYRFMDNLGSKYQDDVSQIAFNYSRRVLGKIALVFYDITTLYYESSQEDEFRIPGYSKDGKFHKPQILLGFLLAKDGYPITYQIFKGNTFEGDTLIPSINELCAKFNLDSPIIIADSGMLSNNNLLKLENKKLKYIVGARIKNSKQNLKNEILSCDFKASDIYAIAQEKDRRLIITFSTARAHKDAFNRQKGIRRLEKKIKSGNLTKSNINNRGYNKFLNLQGSTKISLDYDKVEADSAWDGLKGYITNIPDNETSDKNIVKNYKKLWRIEKSFKISKTDLRIRPIYHRLLSRIKAHIAISFAAYTLIIEAERMLKNSKSNISVNRVIEVSKLITQVNMSLKEDSSVKFSKYIEFTQEMKNILNSFSIRVPH